MKADVAAKKIKPAGTNLQARCQYLLLYYQGNITTPNLSKYASVIERIGLGFWVYAKNMKQYYSYGAGKSSYDKGTADYNKAINGGYFEDVRAELVGCAGDSVGPDPDSTNVAAAMWLTLSDGTTLTLPPSV